MSYVLQYLFLKTPPKPVVLPFTVTRRRAHAELDSVRGCVGK